MAKEKSGKQLKIILADDDPDDRFFFGLALKKAPVNTRLITVQDGEKLMNLLSKEEGELPDVIFLDLNMPRKNGSECLLEIKRNKKLENIPVVIYSTSLHEDVADLLFQNGARYYLQKCDFMELPDAILRIFQLLGSGRKPSRNEFVVRPLVAKQAIWK